MKTLYLLLFTIFTFMPVRGQGYLWSTFAGKAGGYGGTDGTGGEARFKWPYSVAVETGGTVYVADSLNHTIRRITPDGVVSTFAGRVGVSGNADGTGGQALFEFPAGIAVDAGGNVYVADTANHTIRKITLAGEVSTLAGRAGVVGGEDGAGGEARFDFPRGIAVDAGGNVYVADTANHTIRKITPGGVVSTLAGAAGMFGSADGAGGEAQFDNPSAIAADRDGNLYVADTMNSTIRKITPGGVVSTLAGTAGVPGSREIDGAGSEDGLVSRARFNRSGGIAVDGNGNVYAADTESHTIRKITPGGVVSTLAGRAAFGNEDGTGGEARFYVPQSIAMDGEGNLYVADTESHTIRKITPGGVVSTFAGRARVSGSADGAGSEARFYLPQGIAADKNGNVYVADTYNTLIRKITPAGVVSTVAGILPEAVGPGSLRFNGPAGIAVGEDGTVYVADTHNSTVRKITPAGEVSTLAGRQGSPGSADGAGDQARFRLPHGIAADAGGNVYVADTGNHAIRKITPAGEVSTVAGLAKFPGGGEARFNFPRGVALDGEGNLYVSDSWNHTIRKISPGGAVRTLAGRVEVSGSEDGVHDTARFNHPYGIIAGGDGTLYVADTWNHIIRKALPLTVLELWRRNRFGSPANTGAGADDSDPDGDGLVNLMEFALGLDAKAPGPAPYLITAGGDEGGGGNSLVFSYRRSTAAFDAGTVFTVEWSDNPAGPWSTQGVTESVLSADNGIQSMRAVLSAGSTGRRFVRLRVTAP